RCDTDDAHNDNATTLNVSDPTLDVPINNITSDSDSGSILISTAPVHDPIPDDITYFEDAYTHLRGFKSKGEWVSIKSLFEDQATAATTSTQDQKQEQGQKQVAKVVAVPVTGQDSDEDHGFNDDDNDFTDALNVVLMNGDFDDVVSTAIHNAYQNGTVDSDRPLIVGTSSVGLGKRRQAIVEGECKGGGLDLTCDD
ncbi:hypothetical protein BGZ47_003758, partial [Haplosporangium gracile]